MTGPDPLVPVSWGELIDKITILEIKVRLLTGRSAVANATAELARLAQAVEAGGGLDGTLSRLKDSLSQANATLWDIENRIRAKEADRVFDDAFVALARSVYQTNDARAAIKRDISLYRGASLIEEKQYTAY